jgi:primosomal protein N' (replication factor Y)
MLFDSLKSRCVPVVVAAPLPGPLDYAVPEDMDVGPGSVVRVPLGGSERWGVVWSGEAQRTENVKAILEVLPTPPLPEDLTAFIDFAARYAMAPPGLFLRMALQNR